MRNIHKSSLLAAMIVCAACAAETVEPESSSKLAVSAPTATPPATTSMTGLGAAGSAPIAPAPKPAAPTMPAASAPAKSPTPEGAAPAPASPTPAAPAPAKPPATPPMPPAAGAGQPPATAASGGSTAADKFCDKYGQHCGYAMPNRHADRAACIANFNATPGQQACKNMHMDTAIAGTAAACNGMPSAFCFSIHCLHVAAIPDPTGVTYCK